MSEHDRWRQRQRAVGDREIAVAHAAGRELDHHLVRAGRVDHDVFDPHRGGVAPIDHCLGSPRAAPTAGRAAPAPRESSAADAAHDRPGAAAGRGTAHHRSGRCRRSGRTRWRRCRACPVTLRRRGCAVPARRPRPSCRARHPDPLRRRPTGRPLRWRRGFHACECGTSWCRTPVPCERGNAHAAPRSRRRCARRMKLARTLGASRPAGTWIAL
jgi:hypothetical protein